MKRLDVLLLFFVFLLLFLIMHRRLSTIEQTKQRDNNAAANERRPQVVTATLTNRTAPDAGVTSSRGMMHDASQRQLYCLKRKRAAKLGFDSSHEWFQRATFSKHFERRLAFHQWVSAERLLRRYQAALPATRTEAWVLLLDGDDAAQHYTNAALAHIRALKTLNTVERDVVVLFNAHSFQNNSSVR